MKLHHLILALPVLATLCGCLPEVATRADADSIRYIIVRTEGQVARYLTLIPEEEGKILRDELALWRQAGFEDFGRLNGKYAASVKIVGFVTKEGSNGCFKYSINFLPVETVVRELDIEKNKGRQYVRRATEADRRFRAFILRCVAEGKFKRVESEVQAQGLEKLK